MEAGAAVLQLAETLLPGGAGFPSFAAAGSGKVLLRRLPAELVERLMAAIGARGAADWIETASRLEAVEPALFTEYRKQVYLAYYEQPEVISAIRELGHPYNDAPLPDGYPVEPFDARRDAPLHGRGRWVDTDAVCRVDLSRRIWMACDEDAWPCRGAGDRRRGERGGE